MKHLKENNNMVDQYKEFLRKKEEEAGVNIVDDDQINYDLDLDTFVENLIENKIEGGELITFIIEFYAEKYNIGVDDLEAYLIYMENDYSNSDINTLNDLIENMNDYQIFYSMDVSSDYRVLVNKLKGYNPVLLKRNIERLKRTNE